MSIPEPLVRPIHDGAKAGGQETRDQNRLVEPGGENAIQNNALDVRLLDTDRFEIGLMIEPARGVVVARAISCRDVERHVQAAGDFVENLVLEFRIGGSRLFRLHLAHLPAARHGHERSLLQFDRFKRFGGVRLAVGRRIGVKDAGEVGGRFCGGENS